MSLATCSPDGEHCEGIALSATYSTSFFPCGRRWRGPAPDEGFARYIAQNSDPTSRKHGVWGRLRGERGFGRGQPLSYDVRYNRKRDYGQETTPETHLWCRTANGPDCL